MRFRTVIRNVPLLHKIIRTLSSLSKTCTVRLSLDKLHFIIPGNEGKDGVQVWSQVNVPTLFRDYKIESNSENEIWLEVNLDALLKVLRSADNSAGMTNDNGRSNATALSDSQVTLKLNKNGNQAIWAIEIRGTSQNGKTMTIKHEVNVHILGRKRQQELNEPLCPSPDIHLVLPNLGELRNVVARLGHIADDVSVSANRGGTMVFTVSDTRLDLSTTWRNLHIPNTNADEEVELPPEDQFFATSVSIKGLLKFLNSHLVGGTAIACICERHCIIAYVYIGEVSDAAGVLTFFIPAKNTGD